MTKISRRSFIWGAAATAAALTLPTRRFVNAASSGPLPNVLWLLIDDINAELGCYPDDLLIENKKLIATPKIDELASNGTLFKRAYVTGPICSPSRTAMLTGYYQTTVGGHHHRSGRGSNNGRRLMLPAGVKTIPELFRDKGYYTSHLERTDENFSLEIGRRMYDKVLAPAVYPYHPNRWTVENYRDLWRNRGGKPFFAQVSLPGPKEKNMVYPGQIRVDPRLVKLPAYYYGGAEGQEPDLDVLQKNWALYLDSIARTDEDIKDVCTALERDNVFDNTIIVIAGDNGKAHLRGKQFLYEEGTRVPLIIKGIKGSAVPEDKEIDDLVSLMDVGPTCLQLAGIGLADYKGPGKALFEFGYTKRKTFITARDRADETIDRSRAVEGPRYKYIRNYYSHKSHMQPNKYKDELPVTIRTRKLRAQGKLTTDQSRIFETTRPIEELYDLVQDPLELNNLALATQPPGILWTYRNVLRNWIVETGDLGVFPEPVFFELASEHDWRPGDILSTADHVALHARIEQLWRLGQSGVSQFSALVSALTDERYGVRYTAAYWLGVFGSQKVLKPWQARKAKAMLLPLLSDTKELVRLAAARALALIGYPDDSLDELTSLLNSENETIRLYALMAFEDMLDSCMKQVVLLARTEIRSRKTDSYDYAKIVATRLDKRLDEQQPQCP